ncbi:MAG: endonuclease NucS [Proteobacteria bacterium]|nr:endonuclease NucS [Pseudomonadota bacterium]
MKGVVDMDYSEKDIEDYLADEDVLSEEFGLTYLQRQFQTSYGIIDILAYQEETNTLVVIEIKKGVIDENAVGQIMRYIGCMNDLIIHCKESDNPNDCFKNIDNVTGLLIGSKLSDNAISIIRHFDFLDFYSHNINMVIELSSESYTRTAESLLSDFKRLTETIQDRVKYAMDTFKKLAEYERDKANEATQPADQGDILDRS